MRKFGLLTTAIGITLMGSVSISVTAGAEPDSNVESVELLNTFKIDGILTSSYGKAADPFKTGAVRQHKGIDFKAPTGTPIYAPADGQIIEATGLYNNNPSYGKVVVIKTEGGVTTMLAHLDGYAVEIGQQVLKGQKIAEIGSTGKSTGPHVHIETRVNGVLVNPMTVWNLKT